MKVVLNKIKQLKRVNPHLKEKKKSKKKKALDFN